jgi:hypothetical protein
MAYNGTYNSNARNSNQTPPPATQQVKLKPMTVGDIKDDDAAVYVLNKTGGLKTFDGEFQPAGAFIMSIALGDGEKVDCPVPNTHIPIDLSTKASPRDLRLSSNLRQAVAKRAVMLVWPHEAEQMLSTPIGMAERARLDRVEAGDLSAITVKVDPALTDSTTMNISTERGAPMLLSLFQAMGRNEITEPALIDSLTSMATMFSPKALRDFADSNDLSVALKEKIIGMLEITN